MSAPRPPQLSAALLMLGSTVGFGLMAITIRLASHHQHTFEVAFFRNFFGLLAFLVALFAPAIGSGGARALYAKTQRTQQLPRYFVRCLIGVVSMYFGFWAIANLPLSQAISLAYSSPIFVTIAAVFLLGERVRIRRWLAVIAGFIGVLVIVRPWSHAFTPGSLIAVAAAVITAIVAIQIKQLSRNDSSNTIVLWTYLFWVPMSLLPAVFVWRTPHGIEWLWLILSGVLGTVGQLLWTRALKIGEVSALTPISFVQLLVVTLAGWLWFDEPIDRWTMFGAGFIFTATVYIAHREAQLARLNATNAPTIAAKPGE